MRARGWHDLLASEGAAWRGYGQDELPTGGWSFENRTLKLEPRSNAGDLITRRRFRNFELRFDWRLDTGGNSGVLYHVTEDSTASHWTGPEYQLLDDVAHPAATGKQSAGALYGLFDPVDKTLSPTGEWNSARIVVTDNRIEHWLNGRRIVNAPTDDDEWRNRVSKSKFRHAELFGQFARGHLCLQDHDSAVAFRRMYIRELAPTRRSQPINLFGSKLSQMWQSRLPARVSPAETWELAEETLTIQPRATGYLHTQQQFGNFILSFEWRYPNQSQKHRQAGVLIRASPPHRVWPRSIRIDLSPGSAGRLTANSGYLLGSRLDNGANPERFSNNAERASGEWNRCDIVADDGWVKVLINGNVADEAWGGEAGRGMIVVQAAGRSPVQYRSMRLIPIEPATNPAATAPASGR